MIDIKTIAIVFNPDLAEGVTRVLRRYAAWVVDTPANRPFWDSSISVHSNSAIFRVNDPQQRLQNLIDALPDVEDHFGPDSNPAHPYTRIRVIGLSLTSESESAMSRRGFKSFQRTEDGFEADLVREAEPLSGAERVGMTVDSGVLRIGQPTRFTLTHARCDLHSTGPLHRFEAAFDAPDVQARAVIDSVIDPFLSFREALIELNETLNGSAVLETYDLDLRLEATVDKLGHVSWRGTAGFGYSGGSHSARFEFWIEDDQTSFPSILAQLSAIIEEAKRERR
jgi:hypothetical protein